MLEEYQAYGDYTTLGELTGCRRTTLGRARERPGLGRLDRWAPLFGASSHGIYDGTIAPGDTWLPAGVPAFQCTVHHLAAAAGGRLGRD
jgi:hypothetical protein